MLVNLLWDLATLLLTPLEMMLVNALWLSFVAIVQYGVVHKWARKWIMAVYGWLVATEVEQ